MDETYTQQYAYPPDGWEEPRFPVEEYIPYQPAPYRDVAGAIEEERKYQDRLGRGGLRDLTLSLGVMVSGGMLEMLHDQYIAAQQYGLANAPDIYTRIAEIPVNWLSIAAATGVIATKSAAHRIHEAERFAHADALGEVEQLVTVDAQERRGKRLLRRIGRGAVTLAVGIFAYKAAEHISPGQSTLEAVGTASTAMAGITYAKMRTEAVINRRRHY